MIDDLLFNVENLIIFSSSIIHVKDFIRYMYTTRLVNNKHYNCIALKTIIGIQNNHYINKAHN